MYIPKWKRLPIWNSSYARDFEDEDGKIFHGVYFLLPDGLSHWVMDADSAEDAQKISALLNMAANTYVGPV